MRWQQGRAEVERLIADGRVERVGANREHADLLLAQARRHLISAEALAGTDPEAAFSTLYDAARKALWAILANQGLRPTTRGGHLAVYEAVRAQLDPPLGAQLRPFDRLRRRRNRIEYPSFDEPALTADDVRADLPKARTIVEIADGVLEQMSVF